MSEIENIDNTNKEKCQLEVPVSGAVPLSVSEQGPDPNKRQFMLELSYDGGKYSGWQGQPEQPKVRTIQGELEAAVESITGEHVAFVSSGRTDAGVHAIYQVAAFSSGSRLPPEVLCRALNAALPHTIRIHRIREVTLDFHPIRDVVRKRYRYLMSDARPFPPFWSKYVWHVLKEMDLDVMRTAAENLRGEHDFAAFQTVGSPRKTTVRTIYDITVTTGDFFSPGVLNHGLASPRLIAIEIEANGFLYNMVRAIAGTLAVLGQRRKGFEMPERMKAILDSCDRAQAGPTAPPHGLFMVDVKYDGVRFI